MKEVYSDHDSMHKDYDFPILSKKVEDLLSRIERIQSTFNSIKNEDIGKIYTHFR